MSRYHIEINDADDLERWRSSLGYILFLAVTAHQHSRIGKVTFR